MKRWPLGVGVGILLATAVLWVWGERRAPPADHELNPRDNPSERNDHAREGFCGHPFMGFGPGASWRYEPAESDASALMLQLRYLDADSATGAIRTQVRVTGADGQARTSTLETPCRPGEGAVLPFERAPAAGLPTERIADFFIPEDLSPGREFGRAVELGADGSWERTYTVVATDVEVSTTAGTFSTVEVEVRDERQVGEVPSRSITRMFLARGVGLVRATTERGSVDLVAHTPPIRLR